MTESGQKLLGLLFKDGEEVCVSPDSFGYQSIPLSELSLGSFVLSAQTEKQQPRFCNFSDIVLVAMNPVKGPRKDENVTAFRTFMVELDEGDLGEQFEYVKGKGLPYSACVFSGGKSLHYAITLDQDLPTYKIWRFYAEWILKVMERADQQTKNPTRSIRMAGNMRDGAEMKMVDFKGPIALDDLKNWLSKYLALMPVEREKAVINTEAPELEMLPEWVKNELTMGIDTSKGRNNRWFAIAYECGLHGWDEDGTVDALGFFFQEEHDFSKREWMNTVRSGVKKARSL